MRVFQHSRSQSVEKYPDRPLGPQWTLKHMLRRWKHKLITRNISQ